MGDAPGETAVVSNVTIICGAHGLAPLQPGAPGPSAAGPVVPLPQLLRSHAVAGDSGVLTIDRGTSIRSVFFQDGEIVWAESCDPGHRFSEWLTAAGVAPESIVAQARELVGSGRCRFGEALLRVGALSASELGRAAERFVVELVTSAFTWRDGHYQFSRFRGRGGFEPPVHVTRPVSVTAIVLAAYRAMADVSLATLWLGDFGKSRALAADPYAVLDEAELTDAHAELIRRLFADSFTIAELLEGGPLDPVETIRLVGALDAIGVIVIV
jgi:hypothetical protein